MCKIGNIILVYNAKNKKPIGKHPFIVVNDQGGKICGMYAYDFMGILLSSADTPEKKTKLTRFTGNFPIASNDKDMKKKAGQIQTRILMQKQTNCFISIKRKPLILK